MWPNIGPYPLYGIVYGLGAGVQFLICDMVARRLHLRRRVWIAVGVCYFLGMFPGAKVLFDVLRGHFSLGAMFTWRHWLEGGMWGGPLAFLVLAVPAVLVLARDRRAGLDLVALSLPIPLMIAKLACLSHGCCYGRPTGLPWAIAFPPGGAAPAGVGLHPTQVYEILVLLAALGVLCTLDRRRWEGTLLLWFLGIYGPGRALVELGRGDLEGRVLVGAISVSQVICAGIGLLSILVLMGWRRGLLRSVAPPDPSLEGVSTGPKAPLPG